MEGIAPQRGIFDFVAQAPLELLATTWESWGPLTLLAPQHARSFPGVTRRKKISRFESRQFPVIYG